MHKLAGLLHNKNIKVPAGSLIPTGFFFNRQPATPLHKAFRIYQVLFHFLFSQKSSKSLCRWVVAFYERAFLLKKMLLAKTFYICCSIKFPKTHYEQSWLIAKIGRRCRHHKTQANATVDSVVMQLTKTLKKGDKVPGWIWYFFSIKESCT